MPPSDDSRVQKQLTEAFDAFERTLCKMLTEEARRSVDGTIKRLSHADGPFRVRGVEVEVVIRNLRIEAARPRRRARSPASGRSTGAGRGRPPGALRTAILDAFSSGDHDVSTDDIRGHLQARKVKANADNLHQHLRRLVQAGELDRTGRGVYRRRTPSAP